MGNFIQITSLSNFLEKIENEEKKFYYRGEPKDYGSTKLLSSAYREVINKKLGATEIINLREEYYREIGYSLNVEDVKNFIAYSQHHGLPTELLDITENPLVALYFACQEDQENNGYIYSIDYLDTTDLKNQIITENITEQKINFTNDYINFKKQIMDKESSIQVESYFEKLLCDSFQKNQYNFKYIKTWIKVLYKKINSFNMSSEKFYPIDIKQTMFRHSFDFYRSNFMLNKKWNDLVKVFNEKLTKEIIKENSTLNDLSTFLKNFKDIGMIFPDIYFIDEFTINIFILVIALDLVFNPLGTTTASSIIIEMGDIQPEFNFLNYLIHKPSVIFDRMRNQQGLFIYQNVIAYDEKFVPQEINSKKTYEIKSEDKKNILNQLESVGISQKFIYPDSDNIAQYIKKKYLKH